MPYVAWDEPRISVSASRLISAICRLYPSELAGSGMSRSYANHKAVLNATKTSIFSVSFFMSKLKVDERFCLPLAREDEQQKRQLIEKPPDGPGAAQRCAAQALSPEIVIALSRQQPPDKG